MKVFVPVVAVACGLSTALAFQSSTFRGGARQLTAEAFKMKPVRTIQARVVGSPPTWNASAGDGAFLFQWYNTVELNYRGGMDTVNTASIEGALKFVQSEGIDYRPRGADKAAWCKERKNGMKNVMFLDITFAQPEAAVAQWESEYGPYSAMDSNQCTPEINNATMTSFPLQCHYFNGTNGQPKIGAYIGGEDRSTDGTALYPGTWWFSYPNTCALEARTSPAKTEACRASTPVGLCPFGVEPDGVACTYKYKILGWVPIDDLVGITAMNWKDDDTKTYTNFTEFCNDDQVEFKTYVNGTLQDSIPFWADPTNTAANTARATSLVQLYTDAIAKSKTLTQVSSTNLGHFVAIPTVETLTAANPACYENVPKCAVAGTKCKRATHSQICSVCEASDTSAGCVAPPNGYTFPTLVKATAAPTTEAPTPTSATPGTTTATPTSTSPSPTPKSAASSLSLSLVSAASVAVSLALSFVLA